MSGRMGRQGVVWRTPDVTADGLKMFASVTTVLANFGIVVVQNGIIHLERYTQESLAAAMESDSFLMLASGVGVVLQLLAGLAVTLCAFLLVEGYRNTSSFKRYLLTMLAFAAISEIPYDLGVNGRAIAFSGQNVLFTLAVCLLMLYFLDMFRKGRGFVPALARVVIVCCAAGWVSLLRTAYGLCMVLLVAILHLLYTKNVWKTVLGALVSLLYVTGPLAFYGIWCYNGVRKNRFPKYAYYALYPAHLLVFWGIARIVG